MEKIFINLAISELLEAVQDAAGRKKWARAMAKVFVAIQQAAAMDKSLRDAIQVKVAETK